MPRWNRSACISLSAAVLLPGVAGWALGSLLEKPAARPGPTQVSVRQAAREMPSAGRAARGWMESVRAAPAGELASLYEAAAGRFSDRAQRQAAQRWLLAVWVSRDPRGAVEFAKQDQTGAMSGVLGELIGTMAPDLADELLSGDASTPLELRYARFAMARQDPLGFLKRAAAGPDGGERNEAVPEAMGLLAREHPQEAAGVWAALKEGESRTRAAVTLAAAWYQQDADAARSWIESLPDGRDRRVASHAWLNALAATDPRAAWAELSTLVNDAYAGPAVDSGSAGDEAVVGDCRLAIVQNLAKDHPLEALTILSGLLRDTAEDSRDSLEDAFVQGGVSALPQKPGEFISTLTEWIRKADLLPASTDGDSDWSLMERMLLAGSAKWNTGETLEAVQLLAAAPGDGKQVPGSTLSMFLRTAAEQDPAAAVRMFASLPEAAREPLHSELLNVLRGEALAAAVKAVPENQWSAAEGHSLGARPEENAGLVAALPDTPAAGAARRQFASEWAVRDPEAAAAWVRSLPPSSGATESARGTAAAWAGYDDASASAWADSLPAGPMRDGAAAGLVPAIAPRDPEAAWQWAASVTEAGGRAEAFIATAKAWKSEAPPEFRTAFAESLTDAAYAQERTAELLQLLDPEPSNPKSKGGAP